MKRIIIYHDDADGKCSAAIAAKHARQSGIEDIVFASMQHGEPVPWFAFENFNRDHDQLWILDFSFDLPVMRKMAHEAGDCFVWLDHHKTVIETLGDEFSLARGIRDQTRAACLLTWDFCFLGEKIPLAVQYIADRDIWAFNLGQVTRFFYETFQGMKNDPESKNWETWLGMDKADVLAVLQQVMNGQRLYEARIRYLTAQAKRLGVYEPMQDESGNTINALKVNFPGTGDMGQVIKDMGYDVAHCWVNEMNKDLKLVRTHSLYSKTVDVGAIAKAKNGGGHKHAAGWVEILEGVRSYISWPMTPVL